MQTGTKISLVAHATLIGVAVFGMPFSRNNDAETIQVSQVSIMTSTEFEAMSSRSPTPSFEQPDQMQVAVNAEQSPSLPTPDSTPEPLQQPDEQTAPTIEQTPDVSGLQEQPQPEITVESPVIAPQANDSVGTTLVVPDAPIADQQRSGQQQPKQPAMVQPKPRPAPRIDTTAAEKPPTDAKTAPEVQQATTPDAKATKQVDEAVEKAPKQAATEIVTVPEVDPNSAAPAKSSRPRGRPRDIAKKAKQAKAKAEKLAKAAAAKKAREAKAAEAEAIRDALIKATQEQLNSAPKGPPLTSSERNGLVLAVQQCWNVPVGVQDAGDLVVVLSVELKRDGSLAGNPRLIDPPGTPQGTVRQAFEAGRRALIRCAPYALPADKYEQWRQLEVVFNPKTMVVK